MLRRPAARAVAEPSEGVLSKVERMRQELDDLEAELRQASEAGELCARRSRRLRERSRQLSDYALEHVAQGDEDAARSALQIKESVRDALESATRRAEANAALAAKLEGVIELKQRELLAAIRGARAELERRTAGDASAAAEHSRELRRASSGARRRGAGGSVDGGSVDGGSVDGGSVNGGSVDGAAAGSRDGSP